jgi:hypothetical protein
MPQVDSEHRDNHQAIATVQHAAAGATMRHLNSVTFVPQAASVEVPGGVSLFEAANWASVTIECSCGARGTCGKWVFRYRCGCRWGTAHNIQAQVSVPNLVALFEAVDQYRTYPMA